MTPRSGRSRCSSRSDCGREPVDVAGVADDHRAVTTPTPRMSVSDVPDAATAARIRLLGCLHLRFVVGDVGNEFAGDLDAMLGHLTVVDDLVQGRLPWSRSFPWPSRPARAPSTTRAADMPPCSSTGPDRGAVSPTASTPGRDHRRHVVKTVGAERGDRDRAGVVRVVLLRPARTQQPGPRRQHRGHVDTVSPAATSCWARR